ncbi:MAG: acyltransferase [Bryocella sp.]
MTDKLHRSNLEMPNLDLLRSVAVIGVIGGHLLIALQKETIGGIPFSGMASFGVYMFFVHTSLVLMWSLQRRPNTLDFYIRRAFRLYPLAILATVFVALTRIPVARLENGIFSGVPFTLRNVVISFSLVHPVMGTGEFILGTLWTLTPEMFMYMLLPCLFFYARSVRKLWPLLVLWFVVVALARQSFPPADVSSFGVLAPDFLAGVIAYVGFLKRRAWMSGWFFALFLFTLLAFYLTVYTPRIRNPWVVCLAMGLLLPSFQQISSKAFNAVTHTIAKYSYGIYLFHVIALYFAFGKMQHGSLGVRLAVALVPLALSVAAAYHLIEKPMIQLGARVAAKIAGEHGLPSERSLETLEPAP